MLQYEWIFDVCLESLKAQRSPQIEMIFIDDGSTDSTGAMLDAFARTSRGRRSSMCAMRAVLPPGTGESR
ncbi:MAG: glycosyltransferase [Christensenellales bacterium]